MEEKKLLLGCPEKVTIEELMEALILSRAKEITRIVFGTCIEVAYNV